MPKISLTALVVVVVGAAACGSAGGAQYAKAGRQGGDVDRGEVNGRMFDFVSNKPEGDDWQIRIRGNSMWASYGKEEQVDDLGTVRLTDKESDKLWELIDAIDIGNRKPGKKDEDEGYLQLRLREPTDSGHEAVVIYVSRTAASKDDDVINLAEFLRGLISKYKKEKPNF